MNGEWWIDEGGQTTFADGDVGDMNHEIVAFRAALGIDPEEHPDAPEMYPGVPLSNEAITWLQANDANEEAIKFLKNGLDPRAYALRHMNWIRVKDDNFQMWDFNDDAMNRIADFIYEETGGDLDDDAEIYVEQLKDHKTWSIPAEKLLAAGATSTGLQQYAQKYRGWVESVGGGWMETMSEIDDLMAEEEDTRRMLLIDDTRTIHVDRTARTYDDGIVALRDEGPWDVLYLDHDLGEAKSGYDIANWLERNPQYRPMEVTLVTGNPVGRENIARALLAMGYRHAGATTYKLDYPDQVAEAIEDENPQSDVEHQLSEIQQRSAKDYFFPKAASVMAATYLRRIRQLRSDIEAGMPTEQQLAGVMEAAKTFIMQHSRVTEEEEYIPREKDLKKGNWLVKRNALARELMMQDSMMTQLQAVQKAEEILRREAGEK